MAGPNAGRYLLSACVSPPETATANRALSCRYSCPGQLVIGQHVDDDQEFSTVAATSSYLYRTSRMSRIRHRSTNTYRNCDYLLGGKDNYPADRAVAESMIAQLPNVQLAVQWNRAFLRRVVRYLIREAGVAQIIDIGAGLPTVGNTHEIARHAEATEQAHVRSRAAVMKLVSGLDVVEPGLTWPPEWRPDPGEEVPANAAESYYCVVVARKRR